MNLQTTTKMNLLSLLILLLGSCEQQSIENRTETLSSFSNSQVWYVSEFPNPCPSCIWPHKIMFGNDTVINSLTYKKVLDYRGERNESESKAYDLGFLRETEDNKIYWLVNLFGKTLEEILIYDFNAQVNDTIDNYWVVTNIDTVNVLGVERKRILLITCDSQECEWIQGIGDLSDLLKYPSKPKCGFNYDIAIHTSGGSQYQLNCVESNANLIYKNNESNNCWIYKAYNE